VLPTWLAGDSTLTALLPYRQGLLPSVRAFIEHLAVQLPKAVACNSPYPFPHAPLDSSSFGTD
jgi:hypothetical protein